MTNLNNEKYCNKLLIISSDILNKKFNKKEISYIASKLLDSSIKYNENVGFMLKKDIDRDAMKVFNIENSVNLKTSYGGTSTKNIKKMLSKLKKEFK